MAALLLVLHGPGGAGPTGPPLLLSESASAVQQQQQQQQHDVRVALVVHVQLAVQVIRAGRERG